MVFINEWMANPVGRDDATGEWIELFNSGNISVSLSGWHLQNSKQKHFSLNGFSLPSHGFLVISRKVSGLSLINSNESIRLFDSSNHLVDSSSFSGSASEGKSYSRIGSRFAFTNPTPGRENANVGSFQAHAVLYPYGVPLTASFGSLEAIGLAVFTSFLVTGIVLYIIFSSHEISQHLFPRN